MATIEENLRRVPPQSLEAEESVLGGILLDNGALDLVVEILNTDDFYRESHRKVFRAVLQLSEHNEPADLVTLSEVLRSRGDLADVGGASYLAELAERVPTAANIATYARIVREKSILRGLIGVATDIATRGYDPSHNAGELLDRAERSIFAIRDRKTTLGLRRLDTILPGTFELIDRLHRDKQSVTGVPTGLTRLDMLTAGLQPSELIIVAGRPSTGKTALCLNIAAHAALKHGIGVGIFSLEMAEEQIALRLLCAEAELDLARIRSGRLTDEEFPKVAAAAGALSNAPIYIDDRAAQSPLEIRAKARRLKRDSDAALGLIIVDYLQLMRGSEGRDSREQEISEISGSLKALAKELRVPVLALSQLNRRVEDRNPPVPRLSDLRESGAIEQDADVIAFIYREEDPPEDDDRPEPVKLSVAKQRNGPIGIVDLEFQRKYTRFGDFGMSAYEDVTHAAGSGTWVGNE